MDSKKVVTALFLIGGLVPTAWAGHGHVDIMLGGPWWGGPGFYYGPPPGYYYPPAYVSPPVVVAEPPQPTVYIEQNATPSDQQNSDRVWYYCKKSKAYYPYVKRCPGGWLQVAPTPEDSGNPPQP